MISSTLAVTLLVTKLTMQPTWTEINVNEFYCMAEAIHFEARGESRVGKEAVAHVILNRVESKHYPDTICGVVQQRKQFSYRNKGVPEIVVDTSKKRKNFLQTADVAFKAIMGFIKDHTKGATHYYAHDVVTPKWLTDARKTLKIGNHTFVKM